MRLKKAGSYKALSFQKVTNVIIKRKTNNKILCAFDQGSNFSFNDQNTTLKLLPNALGSMPECPGTDILLCTAFLGVCMVPINIK